MGENETLLIWIDLDSHTRTVQLEPRQHIKAIDVLAAYISTTNRWECFELVVGETVLKPSSIVDPSLNSHLNPIKFIKQASAENLKQKSKKLGTKCICCSRIN
jgi:hypothetical protein